MRVSRAVYTTRPAQIVRSCMYALASCRVCFSRSILLRLTWHYARWSHTFLDLHRQGCWDCPCITRHSAISLLLQSNRGNGWRCLQRRTPLRTLPVHQHGRWLLLRPRRLLLQSNCVLLCLLIYFLFILGVQSMAQCITPLVQGPLSRDNPLRHIAPPRNCILHASIQSHLSIGLKISVWLAPHAL